MLSDRDILEAIEKGDLVIKPFSRKHLKPAGLELHLAPLLLKPKSGKTVDIKREILPDYEEIQITETRPYTLPPQGFVLGATYEHITINRELGFMVEGRSTLGRLGLTVVKTAMIVQPGHSDRRITLELANHGPNPILLYPKMKIAKAAIFRLTSPATSLYDEEGKYKLQKGVGAPIFSNEFMDDELS